MNPVTLNTNNNNKHAASKKSSKSNNDKPTPRQPLTAYNMYLHCIRNRILQGTYHMNLPILPEEVHQVLQDHHEKMTSKRVHRKTPGMIGFGNLSRMASTGWRVADRETKRMFQQVADQEKQAYEQITGGSGNARNASKKTKKQQKQPQKSKAALLQVNKENQQLQQCDATLLIEGAEQPSSTSSSVSLIDNNNSSTEFEPLHIFMKETRSAPQTRMAEPSSSDGNVSIFSSLEGHGSPFDVNSFSSSSDSNNCGDSSCSSSFTSSALSLQCPILLVFDQLMKQSTDLFEPIPVSSPSSAVTSTASFLLKPAAFTAAELDMSSTLLAAATSQTHGEIDNSLFAEFY